MSKTLPTPSINPELAKPTYNPSGHAFTGWLGGKLQLSKQIIGLMPAHHTYVEVFCGASWVLFKKTPSPVEIINDINDDLINLYRVIKHHLPEFSRHFETMLLSRSQFESLKSLHDPALTDILRAVKFYYLLRLGYGCKPADPTFWLSPQRPPNLHVTDLEQQLKHQHDRLSRVTIENRNYDVMIARFDTPTTLFYLDPPYYGMEDYYGKLIFKRDDFIILRDLLKNIKGRFILSLNNVPEIVEMFKDFHIIETQATYSVNTSNRAPTKTSAKNELIICNFTP